MSASQEKSIEQVDTPQQAAPPPYHVMQMVLLTDKDNPSTRQDVLSASSQSVLAVFKTAEVTEEWQTAIDPWAADSYRKIFRRAKPSKWEKIHDYPGMTVTVNTATVRAFLPTLNTDIPNPVKRLQLTSSEEPTVTVTQTQTVVNPADAHPGIVVAVNPALNLTLGKAAAAVGHATQLAFLTMDSARHAEWKTLGYPIFVTEPDEEEYLRLTSASSGSHVVEVVDAGFTEVETGSVTAVAVWK